MSQPQQGSQATQEEIAELESEISFQKVLLSSIDDSVEDREEAEQEVRKEIYRLQKQLKAARRGTIGAASTSQSFSAPQPLQESSPNRSPSKTKSIMDTHVSASHHAFQSEFCISPRLTDEAATFPQPVASLSLHE